MCIVIYVQHVHTVCMYWCRVVLLAHIIHDVCLYSMYVFYNVLVMPESGGGGSSDSSSIGPIIGGAAGGVSVAIIVIVVVVILVCRYVSCIVYMHVNFVIHLYLNLTVMLISVNSDIYRTFALPHRSRSLSQSLPIAKRASWMEASTDKRMTFSRATGSFSKKNEASLIASTSDNDFLAKEHSTFQMDTLAARQSTVTPLSIVYYLKYHLYYS